MPEPRSIEDYERELSDVNDRPSSVKNGGYEQKVSNDSDSSDHSDEEDAKRGQEEDGDKNREDGFEEEKTDANHNGEREEEFAQQVRQRPPSTKARMSNAGNSLQSRPATQERGSRLGTPGRPVSGGSHGSDELKGLAEGEEADKPRELKSVNGARRTSRASIESPAGWRERTKVTLAFPLERQHSCPVCKDVLRYPVKINCGHRLCYSCHQEVSRVEPRCPVDQSPFDKGKPSVDNEFNNEIMELQVICNNHQWGCNWQGAYKEASSHDEKCDYSDILCANDCGAKFQRRFLQKHLDKDCPKRIIPCAYCDDRHLREDKRKHLEECKKVPLPCPNKCDKKLTIAREDLDAHIEQDCPRTKIMCQYEDIGCSHRASREKLPKHYKTGIIEHVRLIYDLVMEHNKRLESHDVQLQDHLNLLQNHQERLADVERISRNQLIWRIEDYTRKLKEAKAGSLPTLFSPSFTTSKHGYRLAASVCLNGDGKGKGTHISVFISVLRGAYDALLKWPFDYRVTFYLLDQTDDASARKHIKFSIKPNPCQDNEPFLGRPRLEKNASFGGAKFAKQEDIEARNYIKDDTIFIKIAVDCDGSSEP